MERHVLVSLAHPDDETFGCGGTIALHARAGTPVTYVCATRGEMGRRMGNPPFTNRENLGDLRERELRAACDALGVSDLRLLGLRDKTVEFVDAEALAACVGGIIAEVRPSLVITFHPEHGRHPDHNAMGAATIAAVAAMPPARRPQVHCFKGPAAPELDLPTVTMDITPVAEVKQAAFRAHRSQSEGLMEWMLARYRHNPAQLERVQQMMSREHFWVYRF